MHPLRAGLEIEGAHTWDVMGRDARVVTDLGTLGRVAHLHELRQVRPGVPDRGAVREGRSVAEGARPPAVPSLPQASAEGRSREWWPRLATVWLDGCSGCPCRSWTWTTAAGARPAGRARLQPLVDAKDYPEGVDVCLVEGAVSSDEDLAKIKAIRERTRTLVSFGDCAVTSNVPGMRNLIGPRPLLERAYLENATDNPQLPSQVVPRLLGSPCLSTGSSRSTSSCPAARRRRTSSITRCNELLEGRMPDTAHIARFGA